MNEMRVMRVVFCMLISMLLSAVVSAQLTIGSETIPRNVTSGQLLTGTVTMQALNQLADTLITSSYPSNRTTLLSWITRGGLVEGVDYTCSLPGCQTLTRATMPLGTTLSLTGNEPIMFGFNLTKQSTTIDAFSLTLTSDAPASCTPPFTLTIGSDHPLVSSTYQPDLLCGAPLYGCFNRDLQSSRYELVEITQEGLCSLLSLPASPALRLSARVSNTTSDTSLLSLKLYGNDTEFVGGCTLPSLALVTDTLQCTLNQSIRAGEYYLCISAEQGTSSYQIQAEDSAPVCGTAELGGEPSLDYYLSAQPYGYAPAPNLSVASAFYTQYGQQLAEYLDDRINEQYGRDCTKGCTIPFVVNGTNQQLTLRDVQTKYSFSNNHVSTSALFRAEDKAPLITGNFSLALAPLALYVPVTTGASTFKLLGGSTTLLTLPLSIAGSFAVQLQPSTYYVGFPQTFVLFSRENITSATWSFGDGQTATTTGGIVTHTYARDTGNLSFSVVATSARGTQAVMSTTLTPLDARATLAFMLNTTDQRLATLTASLDALPSSLGASIRTRLNLSSIVAELAQIRTRTYNDTALEYPLTYLSELSLPERMAITTQGSVPLEALSAHLDSTYASLLYENVSITDPVDMQRAIIDWTGARFSGTVQYQQIGAIQGGQTTPYAVTYLLTLSRTEFAQDTSLIIEYPLSEVLDPPADAYVLVDDTHTGFAIPLKGKDTIRLTILGDSLPPELSMFIIPDETFFTSSSAVQEKPNPFPTVWFGVAWFVWLLGFVSAYILLQEWYKRHYERYLFRNTDDLYNSIMFIYNGRLNGADDTSTRKKLVQTGWTGEQITYAFRKLDGKRTGMWEIPLFSYWERKALRREVARRSGKGEGKVY